MKKKIVSILLALIMVVSLLPVTAAAATKPDDATWLVDSGDNHVWYKLEESNAKLTIGGTGAMPNYNNGSTKSPFHSNTTITSCVIQSGVTNIGEHAFNGCTGLTSVTIQSGVKSIGRNAFNGCSAVNALYIDNIESWYGVTLGNNYSHPLNGSAQGKKLYVDNVETTELVIPDTVTAIPASAFYGCTGLTSVTIQSGVESIGSSAFQNCTGLTSVIVKRDTPPSLASANALPSGNTGFKIYVPAGKETDYQSATNWSVAAIKNKIVSVYTVTVAETTNGTVTSDKVYYVGGVSGDTVTLTVTPDLGYQLKSLKYNDGSDHEITKDATSGEYQFTMPAANVTVTAEFEEAATGFDPCNGEAVIENKTVPTGYTKDSTKWGDYVFAGWYDAKIGGTELTGDPVDGTTYYAHWWTDSTKKTLVLTDGIEVKAGGVYIGGSQTPATNEQLAPYGLEFTAAVADPATPATLSMTNAAIESGNGIYSKSAISSKDVYAGIYSNLNEIELKLEGDNKISITRKNNGTCAAGGYFTASQGSATISVTGSGTLTADAGSAEGYNVYGLMVYGTLINSATLIGKGGKATENSQGVNSRTLTNTSGTLTGYADSGQYANGLNICNRENVNISGGKVVGYGGAAPDEYYGLWTSCNIKVSGTGILELHGGTDTDSNPPVKEALYLENAEKTITISDSGKIVADSTVKNLGSYAGGYTVTGANTDIASKSAGSTLTKAGDANIEISAKTYTVSFNANGGTPAPSAQSTLAYVELPGAMTKDGYAFAGWYKDSAFTQAWNFANDYVRANTTLYAKWIADAVQKAAIRGNVKEDGSNVIGATVELFLGTEKVAATVTKDDPAGDYSFDNVENGVYNIVVTKDGKTKTELVTVDSTGSFSANVELPAKDVSSKVEHKGTAVADAKSDIKETVVGGLDAIAAAQTVTPGDKVTIKLTVEPRAESDVASASDIKALAGSGKKVEFLDLSLWMQTNSESPVDIGSGNDTLLTIVIPFDFTDVDVSSVMLLRNHGSSEKLTKNPAAGQEGFTVNAAEGTITLYAMKFSDYAIAYKEQSGNGGHSGGSYTPGHTVTSDLNNITKVTIDGKTVDKKYYTVGGGNVVLSGEFMKTLTNGKHTVKLYDGLKVATGTITVTGNTNVISAPTGDAGIVLYGALSISSLLGMGWVGKKKRNNQ